MSVKTRIPDFQSGTAMQFTYIFGTLIGSSTINYDLRSYEYTYSEGHDFPSTNGLKYDRGGPFINSKYTIRDGSPSLSGKFKGTATLYDFQHEGKYPIFFKSDTGNINTLHPLPSGNDVTFYGVNGYRRASPLKPEGGLAQALIELKQGVPGLGVLRNIQQGVKRFADAESAGQLIRVGNDGAPPHVIAARVARAVSSGYLTWEFHWKPFKKDVDDFCKNIASFDKKYDKLLSQSSKNIRRRRQLLDTQETKTYSVGPTYGTNPFNTYGYLQPGYAVRDETVSRKVWYSASFLYTIPNPNGTPAERLRYYQTLLSVAYGLEMNPRTVWNVMPWSWLADWVSSTGSSFSNLTDQLFNGLASNYNYVMINDKVENRYGLSSPIVLANGREISGTYTVTKENKTRYRGYSFGFSLNPGSFSARQWGILAALGISRGTNHV